MFRKYLPCYLLGFIILLAVLVRVWGLGAGLPYFFVNDERSLVYGALKMAQLKTLIPALHTQDFGILYYPPLMSYIYLIFLAPFILIKYLIGHFNNFTELGNYFILNPASLWLIARLVNALMGAATVYLIYLIGKKMFNQWVGLISALFLALSFLHIQLSHFTRQWSPVLFFACLVLLFSFYIYQSPKKKYYLWLGVILGLGFGISYVIGLTLIIFLMAHFFSGHFSFWEKIKDKNLWLTLVIFFLLSSIFILLYPQEFLRFTVGQGDSAGVMARHIFAAKGLNAYFSSFAYYFKVLLFYDPLILIFSLFGTVYLWFKSKKIFFIFLSWPIIYISVLYRILNIEPRYIALILPWLIILASYTLYRLIIKFSERTRGAFLVKTIILLLVFIYPLTVAWQYCHLLTQKDTRILAEKWVEENIPAGAEIISNWRYINPIPTKEAILFQKEMDEGSLRVADQVLLGLDDKNYPQPAYNILRMAYIDKKKLSTERNYQYFLVAFWNENDLSPEEKTIIQKARLIQEFKPSPAAQAEDVNGGDFFRPVYLFFSLERLGPIVRIYKL